MTDPASAAGTDTDTAVTELAADTGLEVQRYLATIREVAAGQGADTALPVLLLAASQMQLAGARLGAMVDVVPQERFEPDPGPDTDLEAVRTGLRQVLGGVDDYVDVQDPVLSGEVVPGSLADDLTAVAADLDYGWSHFGDGRIVEALWWWQFSYLSAWGERCAAAVRVLHSLLSHVRLDADEEMVMEAEMAALHAAADPPAP